MEDDRALVDLGIAADIEDMHAPQNLVRQPKKRFVGRRTAAEAAAKSTPNNASIEDTGAVQGNLNLIPNISHKSKSTHEVSKV
jgi:2-(3-amino-3-carboxypropyl)histidine synthase